MSDVPSSSLKIQIEGLQFNKPTSEGTIASMAALSNYLREIIQPVGSYISSDLDEATFQAQNGSPSPPRWILADGRDVTGSAYQTLVGNATVPDYRGMFMRGKNNGRVDGNENPDGDLPVGTFTADKVIHHDHGFATTGGWSGSGPQNGPPMAGNGSPLRNSGTDVFGGNETAPKSITTNIFVRIN